MARPGEAVPAGDAAKRAVELALELVGDGEVFDVAASAADEVVVVLGEVLGQLVPSEVVPGDDATHDAGALEHGQVPVGRALREVAAVLEQLGDAEGAVRSFELVDQRPALRGV